MLSQEEASNVLVTFGSCAGKTLGDLTQEELGGIVNSGASNAIREAAQLLLGSMTPSTPQQPAAEVAQQAEVVAVPTGEVSVERAAQLIKDKLAGSPAEIINYMSMATKSDQNPFGKIMLEGFTAEELGKFILSLEQLPDRQ